MRGALKPAAGLLLSVVLVQLMFIMFDHNIGLTTMVQRGSSLESHSSANSAGKQEKLDMANERNSSTEEAMAGQLAFISECEFVVVITVWKRKTLNEQLGYIYIPHARVACTV
jgi:hypothetical protein